MKGGAVKSCLSINVVEFIGTNSTSMVSRYGNPPDKRINIQHDRWSPFIDHLLLRAKLVFAIRRLRRHWEISFHSVLSLGLKHPPRRKRGSTTTALDSARFKGTHLLPISA